MSTEVNSLLPVRFYLPIESDRIEWMPIQVAWFHEWLVAHLHVADGKYTWTLLTYLQLKEAGFPCALVADFPSSGIVVSHRDFLPAFLAPRRNVYLVCIKADRNPHPWAQFHVVQNPRDVLFQSAATYGRAVTLPHWPQPSLITRDPGRNTTCRHVAYFGRRVNLATEFLSDGWSTTLRSHDLEWALKPRNQWNDYSQVDVTLSVRDWRRDQSTSDPVLSADSKPPSKLVNSWLAGVPALVGPESAFRTVRRTDLDYIEVQSASEALQALLRLKNNPALYRDMVENGIERSAEFSTDMVTAKWCRFLHTTLLEALETWRVHSSARKYVDQLGSIIHYFSKPAHFKSLLTAFRTKP